MTSDILTILQTAGAALISGFFTWLLARPKEKTDYLKTLLEANEKFREEVREDLKSAREELEKYKQRVSELEQTIEDYHTKVSANQQLIQRYEIQIKDYLNEIGSLRKSHEQK